MNTNDKYYKNLTVEMLEKVLSEMPNNPFDYPKYYGKEYMKYLKDVLQMKKEWKNLINV